MLEKSHQSRQEVDKGGVAHYTSDLWRMILQWRKKIKNGEIEAKIKKI